jgi:hypothetical protein
LPRCEHVVVAAEPEALALQRAGGGGGNLVAVASDRPIDADALAAYGTG